ALVPFFRDLLPDGEDRVAVAVGDCLDKADLFVSRVHDLDGKPGQVQAGIFGRYFYRQVVRVGASLDNRRSGSPLDGFLEVLAPRSRRGDPRIKVLCGCTLLFTQL